ncbi:PadR family transcriptional regulator [Nakamurella lactea]|uniref:PadR family transcriptional regulator n=1 Tax=Nakamurella lactea TaxID=459515 RepID=UPI0003FF04A9|nr:PadR family transcriptional regulator [Nakamurella lactea]
MSIKYGLLALLSDADAYGYQLRSRFESATGSVWPLNIGQVYTTLARLDRDGLIEGIGTDGDGRAMYRLTNAGRTELSGWWDTPVAHADRPRDELAIKIALAITTPGVDATAILQTQRRETIRHLQDLTRVKRQSDPDDLSWRLVAESLIFAAEAEVRWLDHCEASLVRHGRTRKTKPGNTSGAADGDSVKDPQATEGTTR